MTAKDDLGEKNLDWPRKMLSTLATLIDRLDNLASSETDVIPWGSPVPSFGDIASSKVATVGLNPSNREFMDELGNELHGPSRRFHTLKSLELKNWSEVDAYHLRMILDSCRTYFLGNPYHRWFDRLELVFAGTKTTYYAEPSSACHLDLIPYATMCKWVELSAKQRLSLLDIAGDTLGLLLRESSVQILILNGRSVVDHFEDLAGIRLEQQRRPTWTLPRRAKDDVTGISYMGVVDSIADIKLSREVLAIGFNHNIQSSFGVTRSVTKAIGDWIRQVSAEVIQ